MLKSDNSLKEDIKFTPVQKFFEIIQELKLDMIDARKQGDYNLMLGSFQDLYDEVFPYIEKHMDNTMTKDQIKSFDDFTEIEDLVADFRDSNSDYNESHNFQIQQKIMSLLKVKKRKLSKLMALAKLNVPLEKVYDNSKSILEDDDDF